MPSLEISCILPAFNEERRITSVINYLINTSEIKQLIIVDDHSIDNTVNVIKTFKSPKVELYTLKNNLGKSGAVLAGLKHVKHNHVLLFDADLFGLKRSYIQKMFQIYQQGFDMVIMNYGGQNWFSKSLIASIPAISGVRILKTRTLKKIPIKKNDRFKLENKINDYIIDNHMSLAVSPGKTVQTPYKIQKNNFIIGIFLTLKSIKECYFTNGLLAAPKTWIRWRYIRSKKIEKIN